MPEIIHCELPLFARLRFHPPNSDDVMAQKCQASGTVQPLYRQ
jgi:hypothetical protein